MIMRFFIPLFVLMAVSRTMSFKLGITHGPREFSTRIEAVRDFPVVESQFPLPIVIIT